MIHVQQIFIEWSDDQAKQQDEEKRLAIPKAHRVPYFEPHFEGVWHRLRYRQSEGYHCTEFVNELKVQGSLRLGSMLMSDTGALLLLDFVWTQDVTGLPKRESRKGYGLRYGQLGRFQYNGEFEDPKRPDGKIFQQMTFNVFYHKALTTNAYLDTEPFHVFDGLCSEIG